MPIISTVNFFINMSHTIFEKIINKEIPATILHEDSKIIIIKDIAPQAPVHLLCITKIPYKNISRLIADGKQSLLFHCFATMVTIAKSLGVEDSFKIITNNGKDAGQEIIHLHFHLQGFVV